MKFTKEQQSVIDRIKEQINVTLETKEAKKRSFIAFEDNLKQNEMTMLKSFIAMNTNYRLEPNGHKCLAIIIK